MDSLENFSPVDTSTFPRHLLELLNFTDDSCFLTPCITAGFININAIRLKKYGLQKLESGESLAKT